MSKRVAAKKMLISRDTYRKMKSYDHKQMCDFLESFYRNGFEDGKKVSDRTIFDLDASKRKVKDWIFMDEDLTSKEKDKCYEEVDKIEYCNEDNFLLELKKIKNVSNYYDLWECIEKDYPTAAKTFVQIFDEIIQPKIKEYLAS